MLLSVVQQRLFSSSRFWDGNVAQVQLGVHLNSLQLVTSAECALYKQATDCRMLAEYIAASPGRSVSEAVQLLSGPPLVRLVHTKEGAQVACAVITYGTAKDRKKAIKGLAGQPDSIFKMAQDEFGHVVLLCILDTVDDTALLKKQILPELQVSCECSSSAVSGDVFVLPDSDMEVTICTACCQHFASACLCNLSISCLMCGSSMRTNMLTGGLIS